MEMFEKLENFMLAKNSPNLKGAESSVASEKRRKTLLYRKFVIEKFGKYSLTRFKKAITFLQGFTSKVSLRSGLAYVFFSPCKNNGKTSFDLKIIFEQITCASAVKQFSNLIYKFIEIIENSNIK